LSRISTFPKRKNQATEEDSKKEDFSPQLRTQFYSNMWVSIAFYEDFEGAPAAGFA